LKPPDARPFGDLATQLRSIASFGAHYLWMAASGMGLSAFHEPAPVRSWLAGWWLGGLALAPFFLWRIARGLFAGRAEAAWWIGAAAAFAPISQVAPFFFPMADRYLYFILPGLLGGALFAAQQGAARLAGRSRELRRAGAALGVLACALLGLRAHERAGIWRSSALLHADAASHYPDGTVASLLRAKRAALAGDAGTALPELERAVARGFNRFDQLEADAAWDGVRADPRFRALVRRLAAGWIESGRRKAHPTQTELRGIAQAYVAREEWAPALASYEAAVAAGGPDTAAIRAEIAAVRGALASGDPGVRVRLAPSGD